MVRVCGVEKDSPAMRAGIKCDDLILSINGNNIDDVLDYMFYSAEEKLVVEAERDGEKISLVLYKDEYEDTGMNFGTFLMDEKHSCRNKCVFCFIDQLPPGMRDTLYFKDDDARLSFLQGNYITLTNLEDPDIDRIIKMKLNVNISVHTTDPELRCRMMNNRFAGEKLEYLRRLAENDIKMNCQIVCCPGLNDGAELEKTLDDLGKLVPAVTSIAVVPVGLTRFREGLYPLEPFGRETASDVIDIIGRFQKMFYNKYGSRIVFPSDEFFLLAGKDLPDGDYYEDYPQYENGVGMMRSLIDEFSDALDDPGFCLKKKRSVLIACGYAPYRYMKNMAERAEDLYCGLRCDVVPVRNDFFGELITVTGLLTARDIIAGLKDKTDDYDELLVSSSMLRNGSDVFLDDMTIGDVERELNISVRPVDNDGHELLGAILGIN